MSRNCRKLDPQELERLLWQLGNNETQLWQQLFVDSHDFREQAAQQLKLFYQKRNFWQYGVKVSVATLGVASLALGAAAVPVLYISSVTFFVNFFINNYIAAVHQSKFSFSTTIIDKKSSPAEQIHLQRKITFWQYGVERHKLKIDNKLQQKNIYKVSLALILSYGLFLILSSQLSIAVVIGGGLYISSLLIEAKQEPTSFILAS